MPAGAAGYIDVGGLTKRYGATAVVDGLSFSVAEGELLTLLGPSGCGKTTTLRCIGGFIAQDSGTIRIAGSDMAGVPPHRRRVGMVFQSYALFPHLSVFENVAFGLRVRKVDEPELSRRVGRALEMVRLAEFATRYPKQLSGGQQQRVALARALVYEPRVLLLDEPLSNLDAKLRVEMRSEIRSLQRALGVTALYVTHDQEEALSISDRVMVMNQGRIEQLSTPWELYNRPATRFSASFVGVANILTAEVLEVRPSEITVLVAGSLRLTFPRIGFPDGREFWLVARPETLCLGRPGDTGSEMLAEGKVAQLTMLGATLRAEVEIAGGGRILLDIVHGGAPPTLSPGERAAVRFDPERIVFIPR
jgi:ABC-type Fe3+/spermidine/putrescine transport system ATPase subunit